MPRSNGECRPWLVEQYRQINPATVLDIGPGVGTYAQAMKHLNDAAWTCIEIWPAYVDTYDLIGQYDRVIIGDVRYTEIDEADLAICGDVLEHMAKDDAIAVIRRLRECCRYLMVSIPVVHYPQGAIEGNPYETHHYHWSTQEMTEVLGTEPGAVGREVGVWCIDTKGEANG